MSAGRYSKVFQSLRRSGQGAFVPFVVLGDPDPDTSLGVLEVLAEGGADMLELGIPFSDPVADGPTIQSADLRALSGGTTPSVAMEILAHFRSKHPSRPLGLLIYANLVQRPGVSTFYRRLAHAGVDSVLVADLPLEESREFRAAAEAVGIGAVSMITPLTRDERLRSTLSAGGPYLYVVSRTGVTGRDADLARTAAPLLRRVGRQSSMPMLLGFGIGRPAQVRGAIKAGAAGAISGSACVEIIARHVGGGGMTRTRRKALEEELLRFTRAMKAATR